jgi:hypothetical protein
MSRLDDIVRVDELYDEVTDETDMPAWARAVQEKFYTPRMRNKSYRN